MITLKNHQYQEHSDHVFDYVEDPIYDKVLFSFAILGNHEKVSVQFIIQITTVCSLLVLLPFIGEEVFFCHVCNAQFKVILTYFIVLFSLIPECSDN